MTDFISCMHNDGLKGSVSRCDITIKATKPAIGLPSESLAFPPVKKKTGRNAHWVSGLL